jgi:hypothetical protein
VDVPVDGEDVEPLDDDVDDVEDEDGEDVPITAPAAPAAPVTPSVAPRPGTASASRGAANPRGRQQRRRKRR